jgi:hypothetical protein
VQIRRERQGRMREQGKGEAGATTALLEVRASRGRGWCRGGAPRPAQRQRGGGRRGAGWHALGESGDGGAEERALEGRKKGCGRGGWDRGREKTRKEREGERVTGGPVISSWDGG